MKSKYRIIDIVDNEYHCNSIEVRKQNILDRIMFFGWWLMKKIQYNDNVEVYPHRTRDMAIAEAELWIEDDKAGKTNKVITTILKEV